MIIADSDVLIDALRGREPATSRLRSEVEAGRLATTSISVFELLSGARSDPERVKVQCLLGGLRVLSFDERAGIAAAEIRRSLESKGSPIGMADSMIAGVCLSRSVPLVTRNLEHFNRVPGLVLSPLAIPEP